MTGSWRWIAGLILLLATLAVVEWQVGWARVLSAWAILPLHLLLLTLAGVLLSYVCKAGRMAHAFRHHTHGEHLQVARISQLHNLAVVLVPMRAGEAAFPLLMKQRFGLGLVETSASLAWFRIMDLALLISIPLCVYLYGLAPAWMLPAFVALVLFKVAIAPALIRRLFQRLPSTGQIGRLITRIQQGIPHTSGEYWSAWAWTLGIWGFKFLALIVLYMGFAEVPHGPASAAVFGGELAAILPVQGLAGAGTYEAGVAAGLAPYGIDMSHALAAAVNVHLFMLTAAVIAALPFLLTGDRRER